MICRSFLPDDLLHSVADYFTAGKSPKTREHYRGAVRRFEAFLGRPAIVGDLGQQVETCQRWMAECHYKPSTIKGTRTVLRTLWIYLHEAGLIPEAPPGMRQIRIVPPSSVPAQPHEAIEAALPPDPEPARELASVEFEASQPPADECDPDGLTIGQLIAAWRQYAKKCTRRAELANMNCAVRALEAFSHGELVAKFGPKKLRAVLLLNVEGYIVNGKTYEGISRSGVNARLKRIKRVFRWGVAEELVSPVVFQALAAVEPLRYGRTEAPELPPVGPVDDAIVDSTLPHLPPVVVGMIQFERLSGCRPGEVCALRPIDIDRSGEVWVYRPDHHKTRHLGKGRAIFIGPKAQEVLRPFLKIPATWHCFNPREAEVWRSMRQPNYRGHGVRHDRAYRPKSYSRAILRVCQKHGIPPWHPNQLRHSMATEVRREFGLEAAQIVLGHSRADVTQVYAEKHEQLGIDVLKRIG